LELERKFQIQIQEEKNRHQDALNKIYANQQEEKENLLSKIRNLEVECKDLKSDNSNMSRQLIELNQTCEAKEIQLQKETNKLTDLEDDYKNLLNELETAKDVQQKQKLDFEQVSLIFFHNSSAESVKFKINHFEIKRK
jgi:hypothetical protein